MPKQESCCLIAIPDSTNWNVRATQQLNGETKNTDHRASTYNFQGKWEVFGVAGHILKFLR